MEEKGQSWLAARHSSTSLTGEDEEEGFHSPPEWNLSRMASARNSKRKLALGNPRSRNASFGGDGAGEDVTVEPDFVDGWGEDEEVDEEMEVDEGEMRKVVMGRVGGWVDWAVGWLDLRGEEGDDEGEGEGEREGGEQKGELDPVELQRRLRRKKKRDEEVGVDAMVGIGVRAAPEGERAGTWSDARWLLHVAMAAAVE